MPMPRRSIASSHPPSTWRGSSLVHQRILVQSMEPRGATASYDPADDSYFLRCCSQSARALRDGLAPILGVPNPRLRVVTEDVGGAFGLKTGPYPEYLAILVAARKIGRPVHWMSNRAEAFLSDNHARDAYSDVELALDERGKFLALRIRHLGSMGAYHRRGRRQHPDREPDALPARHVRHPAASTSPCAACSPTPRPPRPIAAPGVRRRTSSSSA